MNDSKPLVRLISGLLLTAILLALLSLPVQAQSGSIRFETLSVEHGLSQSTVRAMQQDSFGFLWFGTEDGLNKFDGYTFTIYKHDPENTQTISDSTITAIFEDSRGDLWFGTNSGLDRLIRQSETFEHFSHDPANPNSLQGSAVSAIVEDTEGNLWIGTSDGGLNRLNYKERTFSHYRRFQGEPNSLISDLVTALLFDDKGGLWIGTAEGLDYFDVNSGKFTHFLHDAENAGSIGDNHILSLFIDRFGTLWVGTEDGGLNRYNAAQENFTRYQNRPSNPYTLASNSVRAITEDQAGRLWVGTRNGLHQFVRPDEYFLRYQHDPSDQHSLSNDYVVSLYTDRSGILWIGTLGGGLSKYVQTTDRFTLYQHRPGVANSLNNDIVYALLEDREGTVWVGTLDGGLNRLDSESGTFSFYQHNPVDSSTLGSNDVRAILLDHLDTLWVGTNGGGLNRFDQETGRFSRYVHDSSLPGSLSDDRVLALLEDRRGNLWAGTREGGLNLMDRATGQFTKFRHDSNNPNSLVNDYVRALYEDREGRIWIGTNNGLSLLDPAKMTFTNYRNDPDNPLSLGSNRILSIHQTQDGTIWVGTMLGGLNRFNELEQTFHHYTQRQGLPSDTVYGILADKNGFLWVSTNRGLSRFDPQNETFRNYDRRDGLQSYEFNAGAYFQNNRGRMYFGGLQGFNVFDPQNVQDNPVAPNVVITAFKKFNQTERKDMTRGEKIRLDYQDNFISFEFAALDYSAPEKNQYAYKLEGFDKDWVYAGNRRYTSYTNLRGGTYTFRVIGSNQDGVWNENGAVVEIVVDPPFWEHWWFLGSVVALVVGSGALTYRMRLRRIQEQTRLLETQVRERTLEIERRREVAEGLREILAILNSNRTLKESLDAIIRQVLRLMDAQAVIIFRCGDEGYPNILASNLFEKQHPPLNPDRLSLPAWITIPVLQGQPLIMQRAREPLLLETSERESALVKNSALLAVPLAVNDKIDGGLVLLYAESKVLLEEDIQMAVSFADHAALAIANALLRSQAEEIAVSAERNRLARDLHDAVTQTLFATSLIAEVLPRLWERNPEAGKQKITEIRELTRGALAEMRTLLMELRPTALDDVPLTDLLHQLSEAFTGRARVPVKLTVDPEVVLPQNVKLCFYRIAQEALNNIQKHARATQVEILLHNSQNSAELVISDNGVGFERGKALPDHFGLGIMEERAQAVGASYLIDTGPGRGTRITVGWEVQ